MPPRSASTGSSGARGRRAARRAAGDREPGRGSASTECPETSTAREEPWTLNRVKKELVFFSIH